MISELIVLLKANVPFLFRLNYLEKYIIAVHNIRVVPVCHDLYLKNPLGFKQEHIFREWESSNFTLHVYSELYSCIISFRMLTLRRSIVFKTMLDHEKLNQARKKVLDNIPQRFLANRKLSQSPIQFKVSFLHKMILFWKNCQLLLCSLQEKLFYTS